ncbi:MAG: hypothetical protein OEX74_15945 [Gammaproteobacteria bacterium]|jgi:hypothetical protein|nr:hypothetical protein [Gammaproteobacteria bacterium]
MKKLAFSIIAAFLLPSLTQAQAAECTYEPETVNPSTNAKIISTAWEFINQPDELGFGPGTKISPVQAISDGGTIFLAFKHGVTHYHAIPPEFEIVLEESDYKKKTGKFDLRLKPFVANLENRPYVIAKGSALRITLEDRTNLLLYSIEDFAYPATVTMPQWEDNERPDYRVTYSEVMARYVLDDDAIALLSNNRVVALRQALPDEDRYFGRRNLIWDDKIITKKSMTTIQGALKCVL